MHNRRRSPVPFRLLRLRPFGATVALVITVALAGCTSQPLRPPGNRSAHNTAHVSASSAARMTAAAAGPANEGTLRSARDTSAFAYVPVEKTNRILEVDRSGLVLWQASVRDPDDVSVTPGGNLLVNEPDRATVVEISRRTGKIIWRYGRAGAPGDGPGQLRLPDDAFRLANGDTLICDSGNARIIEVDHEGKIVWQYGHTRVWGTAPGYLAAPNDAVPLSAGRVLITTEFPPRILEVSHAGQVLWSLAADRQVAVRPPIRKLSDAVPDGTGRYLVAVYGKPGRILELDRYGHVFWSYGPSSGTRMLDHPSAVFPLTNGQVLISDDGHQRVLEVDRSGKLVWVFGGPGRTAGVSDVKPPWPWPVAARVHPGLTSSPR